ncbi:phosphopentomutase [Roseomonas sp. CCTCC AB2023176]|uniref:phosphopentomutase n=1 Tax=Roseomonas sp. CCTCC AB2023176 TaxID=3342640 RepID=UPI0035E007B9
MTRALVIVMDGVGVGHAPDAAAYGDEGANTLGQLTATATLSLPTLSSLGLDRILGHSGPAPRACWGRMRERSAGKDSTTGHWEIAGAILDEPFRVFDRFPSALLRAIEEEAGVQFIGNVPASGTAIIAEMGEEHVATGRPILYTSADSVLQIAAHEDVVPLDRLYATCAIARRHADAYRIGRVIARPFLGTRGAYARTPRRHDLGMAPPRTVLDALVEGGHAVVSVGKTADLFDGRGFTASHPTTSNEDGMRVTSELWRDMRTGFVFTNLVDFDQEYGHRRDVPGFGRALEAFDAWLGAFMPGVGPDDLLIVTADHGNDPTFRGTDHTREEVPLIVLDGDRREALGVRETFADVAATLARRFGVGDWITGRAFAG